MNAGGESKRVGNSEGSLADKMRERASDLTSDFKKDRQYVPTTLEQATRTGSSMQLMKKTMMPLNDYRIRVQFIFKTASKATSSIDQLTNFNNRMCHPSLSQGINRLPGSRLKIHLARASMAVLRIIMLCALGALPACTETVELQSGLNDRDANEIVSLLSHNGIEANKRTTKEGVTLAVKDNDISRATDVMQAAALPKRSYHDLLFRPEPRSERSYHDLLLRPEHRRERSYHDLLLRPERITNPFEERVRYIHGLSSELENTLQQRDNIVVARIHVVLPEHIAPGEPIHPSSAAVFIKYRLPFDEKIEIPRIRKLVASSLPGLSGEEARGKVSVVLIPIAVVESSQNLRQR